MSSRIFLLLLLSTLALASEPKNREPHGLSLSNSDVLKRRDKELTKRADALNRRARVLAYSSEWMQREIDENDYKDVHVESQKSKNKDARQRRDIEAQRRKSDDAQGRNAAREQRRKDAEERKRYKAEAKSRKAEEAQRRKAAKAQRRKDPEGKRHKSEMIKGGIETQNRSNDCIENIDRCAGSIITMSHPLSGTLAQRAGFAGFCKKTEDAISCVEQELIHPDCVILREQSESYYREWMALGEYVCKNLKEEISLHYDCLTNPEVLFDGAEHCFQTTKQQTCTYDGMTRCVSEMVRNNGKCLPGADVVAQDLILKGLKLMHNCDRNITLSPMTPGLPQL